MYKTQIRTNNIEYGESIEEMMRRVSENNEPIEATAPMIYTEKADGVRPEFDIRTDRFDLALDAIETVQKSEIARAKTATEQQKAEKTTTTETTQLEY